MITEWLDIVDDNDNVIGRASRADAHRLRLKHRSVHVLIFNEAKLLLLQKRSLNKESSPGAWDSSVGGHVESGEDYDTAAFRECKEELGIELLSTPTRLFTLAADTSGGFEFVNVYRAQHEGPFIPNAEEVSECRWFSLTEIQRNIETGELPLTQTFTRIFKQLLPSL